MPLPIRRDYFRENMKVTSCPWTTLPTRRHKSRTSVGAAERRTGVLRLKVSPPDSSHMEVGEREKSVLLQLPSATAPAIAVLTRPQLLPRPVRPPPPYPATSYFSRRKQFRDIKQKPAGCPEMASWPPPSAQSPSSPMIWWQTS